MAVHLVEVRLDQEGDALEHGAALLESAAFPDERDSKSGRQNGEASPATPFRKNGRAFVGEVRVVEQGEQAIRGRALVMLEPGERRAGAVDRAFEHEVRRCSASARITLVRSGGACSASVVGRSTNAPVPRLT